MSVALAIDTSALNRLQTGLDLDVDWFRSWASTALPPGVVRVDIAEVIYLLGPEADASSRLLVVDLQGSGLFSDLQAKLRPEAFLRLVRVGRSAHAPGTLPIPTSWSPYHAQSLISIQSNHLATGERARIEIDLNPRSLPHTFAYKLDRTKRDLRQVVVPYANFDRAVANLEDAVIAMLERAQSAAPDDTGKIVLTSLEDRISLGRSLQEWRTELTKAQSDFVNAPLSRSIRLVGAAGTGKTLSLVIKCLVELERNGSRSDGFRCLFLTHSQSTVETVTQAISTMDHEGIVSRWPASPLKICTLQELANDAMKYDLHGLEPLSNDGLEGRTLQLEAIEAQIEVLKRSDWVTLRARCSEDFRKGVDAARGSPQARTFAFEVMNEFACVLEADGVRESAERRERYLNETRKPWMMHLGTQSDRRTVLNVYDKFRAFLRELGVIGVDQMIADYLGFLDSNRWDNVRQREGYDVVFVDELHLFNRQERMTLHHLMRDTKTPPIVVMAYDSKQSVRDSFHGLAQIQGAGAVLSRDMNLGQTQRFELSEGFRYTPEIARVLEWIDQAFPAAGISEELGADWQPIKLACTQAAGGRPVLVRAPDSNSIYEFVFPRAQRAARDLRKGRRVAVLCASETLFKKYAEAGEYQELFLSISDREQVANLRHAGKRFVFSMPEFVAGIQFDTVFLIEVNDGEVHQGPYATGALRRFVSMVYLGASRAERVLEIYSSDDRGGPSKVLRHAVDRGALDVVSLRDLQ